MVSDITFIFHMCIPWGKTLSLVPKSRSSVKVKYQGHSFQKMALEVLTLGRPFELLPRVKQYQQQTLRAISPFPTVFSTRLEN